MLSRIQKRLDAKGEQGFTLIELLVVIIIIGILLAIAVPSYLGFRDRATKSANQANVRAAIPAIETYASDNDDSRVAGQDPDVTALSIGYMGMDLTKLRLIDAGISPSLSFGALQDADSYCVQSGNGAFIYHYKIGYATINGQITTGACPAS